MSESPSNEPLQSRGAPVAADVAHLAGVSTGTVSHVLNGTKPVHPETAARVERAVALLGYRPNRIARSLAGRSTGTIGMVIPDVANPFFAELMRGAEDVLSSAGYVLVFGNSDNDPAKVRRYLDEYLDRRFDGVIVDATADSDLVSVEKVAETCPVVMVDRTSSGWQGDRVEGDSETGMRLAVDYLVSLGHTRIAFIGGDRRIATEHARSGGFVRALASHGLQPAMVTEDAFTLASGRTQAKVLFAERGNVTAVCAANDLLALSTMGTAAEQGIRVPRDLSVVGYDDIAYARLASPPLTTIRQPANRMGAQAGELLRDQIEGRSVETRSVILAPELVVRRSTAPLHAPIPTTAAASPGRRD